MVKVVCWKVDCDNHAEDSPTLCGREYLYIKLNGKCADYSNGQFWIDEIPSIYQSSASTAKSDESVDD